MRVQKCLSVLVVGVACLAMTSSAMAATTTAKSTRNAEATSPGCASSIGERRDWAFQQAEKVRSPKMSGEEVFALTWKFTLLCEGQFVRFDNATVHGPKAVGTAVRSDIDYQIGSSAVVDSQRSFSCNNYAAAPYLYSSGIMEAEGWISCSSAVPLRRAQKGIRRRYNSTGTVVWHNHYGLACCVTSTVLREDWGASCPSGSAYQTMWEGERYYNSAWAGDAAYSGWVAPCG